MNELIIILSSRLNHKIKTKHECYICNIELYENDVCSSFGIIDRQHQSKERIYTCMNHSMIFNYSTVANLERWQQEYLYENRFINEVWYE